jgi:O-antigen/teichoic acid export membrane protein
MTRGVLIVASFVSSVVVARALSLEDRGKFGLLMAVAALCIQFGNLGLPVANTYLLAREPALKGALLGNSIRLLAGITVVLGLVAWLVIPQVPGWNLLTGAAATAIWFVAASGVAQMFTQNILAGVFKFSASNTVDLVARLGVIGGMIVVWKWGRPTAVTFAILAAAFGLVATAWGIWSSGMRPQMNRWEGGLAWRQLTIGSRAYAACVASFALSRIPLYAVESRAGLEGLAFFTQALVIADTMLIVPAALGTVLFPNLVAISEANERIRATLRMAGLTFGLMLLGVLVAWFLGPVMLPLVYGASYSASMPILVMMFPGVLAYGVCSMMQNALSACGYPWAAVASPLVGMGVTLIAARFASTPSECGAAYSLGAVAMLVGSTTGWWIHRFDRPRLQT